MRPEIAVSFAAAAVCHALLLFSLHLRAPAKPLEMSDAGSPVTVNLVEPSAETPSAPPEAAASPEPTPEPTPPTPEPTPEPTPDMTPPAPVTEPEPTPVPVKEEVMSIPAPLPKHHERPKPHTAASAQKAAAASHASSALPPGTMTTGGSSSASRPGYRYNPRPDYPAAARAAHQEGVVMLGVRVNAGGRTDDVSVARSSGYPLLDNAAVEAVRRWTFDPAREGGFPVASRVDIPVRFTLRDADR